MLLVWSVKFCFDTAMDTELRGRNDNQGTRFGGGLEDEEVRLIENITREGGLGSGRLRL